MSSYAEPTDRTLECRRLGPEWETGLFDLCRAIDESGDGRYFHPHPFTQEAVSRLCRYAGRDLYYVMVAGPDVLAYGLLRGWDEGFAVPSLGIATHPQGRSSGLGTALMHFLHAAAIRRGAERVRLRVHVDNTRAAALYERLGYVFVAREAEFRVGFKQLEKAPHSA